MPVQVACPQCDAAYQVADERLGRIGRCKKCRHEFRMVPHTRAHPGSEASASRTDLDSIPRASEAPLPDSFGRYQVLKLLGKGGMGSVYLAHDTQLNRHVALKVPHIHAFADHPDVRERFFREAQAAARFHHPNFCPIFDIGEVAGVPYLTMAFIEGRTLADSITRGEGWPPRRAVEVVRELALALARAHREGIVHRDLKPANVMVDAEGRMILMDFGLARWYDDLDSNLTPTGAILGTPAYMPPEQAEGHIKLIGPRSDLYSLGVILYELLTGRRPFEGPMTRVLGMIAFVDPPPPSTFRPGLDPRLEAICLKAMAKKIADRHASMDEFAGALAGFLIQEAAPPFSPAVEQVFADLVAREPTTLRDGRPPMIKLPRDDPQDWATFPRSPIRIGVAAAFVVVLFGLIIYMVRDKGRIKSAVNDPKAVETSLIARVDIPPKTTPEPSKIVPPPDRPKPPVVGTPAPPPVDPALITNTLGMRLRLIPAGEFDMGSDDSDPRAEPDEKVNGKKHHVQIKNPFYLGTTELTVGQFREFIRKSNYRTEAERDGKGYGWNEAKGSFQQDARYTWRSPGFKQTDDHPVVLVTHNDGVALCAWLSKEEGQAYRLPTEAEWEYSCRSGQASRFWFGDDPEGLAAVGNVVDGTLKARYSHFDAITARDGIVFTAPVAHYRPNDFGLYDMHGNVWEWCADWYDSDYYAKSPRADPPGPSEASGRVMRGGSWNRNPLNCRSANRDWFAPEERLNNLGFRLARVPSGK